MKKLILLGLVAAITAGCSTNPINPSQANSIPTEREYKSEYFERTSDDQAQITFLRDKGMMGGGCSHDIFINNVKVFAINSNEKATVYLKPDYYIFRLSTGNGICANVTTSQETDVKSKSEIEYRISTTANYDISITRMK